MPKISAGLLMFRYRNDHLEFFLVHPGGPFFRKKDDGSWTIPKGEPNPSEDLLTAAQREFFEETGVLPVAPFLALTPIKQSGGKTVHAWAFAGDCDPAAIRSNVFSIEWPPRSGKQQEFPEIDRADFFTADAARCKINAQRASFIDELTKLLSRKEPLRHSNVK
ncbi:NUDIX domain-containing protein [soil metagenome]